MATSARSRADGDAHPAATLSLTLYGDLDVSVLDELPPGRTPIVTRMTTEQQSPGVWESLRREVAAGHQAYVVYPVIEDRSSS